MKVEYSKRSDLRKIAEYHRRSDNPVIGERIAVGIGRTSGRIARAPEIEALSLWKERSRDKKIAVGAGAAAPSRS